MGDVKSYQGSPVSVVEDVGDGTSLVAVLQEVASGDLLDWAPPSAAAAATPELVLKVSSPPRFCCMVSFPGAN